MIFFTNLFFISSSLSKEGETNKICLQMTRLTIFIDINQGDIIHSLQHLADQKRFKGPVLHWKALYPKDTKIY